MKAKISTFVGLGRWISLDVKVEFIDAKVNGLSYLAASRNIDLTDLRIGESEFPTSDVVETTILLLTELSVMAQNADLGRLSSFLALEASELMNMQEKAAELIFAMNDDSLAKSLLEDTFDVLSRLNQKIVTCDN